MSQFCLKIIALIAMTIDHVGLVFGMEGWNLLPLDSSVLRAIGRIAFPLFAFCLAQGWHKTHDRKQYFQNLAFGALTSQIPFCMAFDSQNLTTAHSAESLFVFSWPYLLLCLSFNYSQDSYSFDNFGRDTHCDRVCWNIVGHNSSRAYNRIVADCHPLKNGNIRTHPNIFT